MHRQRNIGAKHKVGRSARLTGSLWIKTGPEKEIINALCLRSCQRSLSPQRGRHHCKCRHAASGCRNQARSPDGRTGDCSPVCRTPRIWINSTEDARRDEQGSFGAAPRDSAAVRSPVSNSAPKRGGIPRADRSFLSVADIEFLTIHPSEDDFRSFLNFYCEICNGLAISESHRRTKDCPFRQYPTQGEFECMVERAFTRV